MILDEIASEAHAGGRACPVSTIVSAATREEVDALTTALDDPARFPATAIARVFRRRYPAITIKGAVEEFRLRHLAADSQIVE